MNKSRLSSWLSPCFISLCFITMLTLFVSTSSYGYSYAAAGKEVVIDGREAIAKALLVQDFTAVKREVDNLDKEFAYLKKEHKVDLLTPMLAAINAKDAAKISALMDSAVYEEIVRRLDGAEKNLANYQVAKVLVVKSKLFLDLISQKLDKKQRQQANDAIQGVLGAIGNPGVFGVGKTPADPKVFAEQQKRLFTAIASLK